VSKNLQPLVSCLEMLKKIFGSAELAIAWLNYPHPNLGTSPLIALSDGKEDKVLKILEKIEKTVPS